MNGKFIVCTDSGCDLSIDALQEHGIFACGMKYEVDGVLHSDTMRPEDYRVFYEQMRKGAAPRTAQMNEHDFVEFWTPLITEYKLPIVHISLGSGVSGTYFNGSKAAASLMQEYPGSEIHVIDSTLCSLAYGMITLEAARQRDAGVSAAECAAWLNENKLLVNTYYTTEELKYFFRSGRVSRMSAVFGTALRICPILNLDLEGHLLVQDRVRGYKQTLKKFYENVGETVLNPKEQVLYVSHSDCIEKATEMAETLKAMYGFKDVFYSMIGTTIGTNCGPGVVAVFYYGKQRTMKGYKG